jgi:hypothetical protein
MCRNLAPFSFGTSLTGLALKFQAVGDILSNRKFEKTTQKFDLGRIGMAWDQGEQGQVIDKSEGYTLHSRIASAAKLENPKALDCPTDIASALAEKAKALGAPQSF